jgi:hypothetical protein
VDELKIDVFPNAVKFDGIFSAASIFNNNILKIITEVEDAKESAIKELEDGGVLVEIHNFKKTHLKGSIPSPVLAQIILEGIAQGRGESNEPVDFISTLLSWMMNEVGATNKNQLTKMLEVDVAQPFVWAKKQYIPYKYIVRAFEIGQIMREGCDVISRVTIEDRDIAKTIGVTPGAIIAMKKDNPEKYGLLLAGMKMRSVKEAADE